MHHLFVNKEILEREKPIWLGIVRASEGILENVRDMWKKRHEVPRVIFSWPSEDLETTDKSGKVITHMVTFHIPEGMNTRDAAVVVTQHTKPYAMLVLEREGKDVRLLLESFHGTRCWRLPIRRHGDVDVLEKEKATTDTERLGILWRPSQLES